MASTDLDKIGDLIKSRFDIKKVYDKYKKDLKGAEEGKVVTRFPPEPSGFLHIGHVKALFLNYHYSKIFNGKMILRFDDTNPAKEKQEYVDNIIRDMKTLGVEPSIITHTSDYFDLFAEKCRWMIENNLAYCDNTDVDTMRKERFDGIPSKCRDQSVEENLKIWDGMLKGDPQTQGYCVRAKLSFDNKNKCLRDPTIYRFKKEPHQRTGNKWCVYPTYDFACPIIDSHEGVTHAMRTNEYADRIPQYEWFQKKMNLRKVKVVEFSRLCFVSTIISKRNLSWFVNNGIVDGWNDPRFPTVQGIMRRGLVLPTLIEFMLDQGPSKNNNLMEWDKIWAINKSNIDGIAGKYTAVSVDKPCVINVTNVDEGWVIESVPVHPKCEELKERLLFKNKRVWIEHDDAELIKEGEKITLMKWGNFNITKKTQTEIGTWAMEAEFLPEDKDWKGTQKITWLAVDEKINPKINIIEYDHLITVPKLEENDKLEDFVNPKSKLTTQAWADPSVRDLPEGALVQFERRCYAKLDKKYLKEGELIMDFIFIPDGKSKGMSNIKTKVDAAKFAKGGDAKESANKKEEEPKKPKGEKKQVDESVKAQKMKEKAEKAANQEQKNE